MNKILSIIIVIAFLILAASFIHAQTIIYVVSEEETPASTQTSALSSEQTVTITLNGGYNFISLPVTPDDTGIETVIASIKDKLDRIWYYDASIDKWSFYNPDPIFSSANNLLTLEPGKGYQFNMKQAATLKVIGMPYEFQPITLEANKWHMIGTFFSDVALSNILGSCSLENIEISTIDREGNNVPIAKSPSTLLESKKGYNIKSTNNCVLEEILDVSDTVTTTTTENRCSECGDGFFNFCDDDECKALGNCEFTDECREIISVDIPANLCNNQGGALCEKYEVCRGTVLSASDTNRCCLGECKLPNSFDWRNRHGENWNSPVKNQGSVSSCTSFGAIAAIEATINLYYNQHLDIDLSEQATLSCGSTLYQEAILNEDGHGDFNSAPAGDCFGVNSPASNLCRAKVVGFVDEQCYPYVDHFTPSTFVCDNLCSDYQNRLWKVTDFFQLLSDGAYTNFVVDDNNNVFYEGPLLDRLRQEHLSEEELKKAIIKYGPVGASSVVPGHTASIVGWENTDYELIEQCDANEFCTDSSCNTICTPGEIICKNIHYSNEDWSLVKGTKLKCSETGDGLEPAWESGDYFCTDEELCYRGECVPKKSVKEGEILCVGETLGENTKVNRYSYKPSEGETRWIYKNSGGTSIGEQGYGKVVKNAEEFGVVGVVKTPIIPPPNKNYEINCEDKDNDNFCNWGISENKPSTCPASCKPEEDWDDSDANIGALGVELTVMPDSTTTPTTPSEQTVTITLNEGYNFISLSVTPDDTRTETIIESIEDKLERIWYYDASIDKWYFYNPDPIFSSANNLLTLEPGKGYQFNMKQAATLKVIGMPYEFQPITLEANKWYMIGTFFSDVTLSNILGNCSLEKIEISTMDEEGNNVPIAKSSSTLLESKKGYNIKSTNDCELGKILDVSDTVTTSTTPSQCGQQCGSTTCQSYETCITEYPDDEGIDAYETNTCILSSECGATCNEWVQKYSNILNIGIQDEPCSEFANCAGIERDDFNVEVPCEDGYLCVGKCTVPEPSVASVSLIVENRKLESKYSNKEVFLISDTDWEDVLSLVPITTWTENAQIIKYPTLIYHEEDDAFDADSIIYFIQQYSPSRVTIIGQTPQELDNLLIAPPELGAGLSNNQIQRISINDYFSYWTSFGKVVYVENNYELALLASTYASLINAPLIIQGTNYDSQNVFSNRKIICVGNVNPTGSSCNEQYNLEQLQRKYVDETGTDKIMLVNPNDLDIKVINDVESFFSKDFTKSSGIINEIYSGTSLAAPILASAKQELILTINSPNYEFVDQKLKSSITNYHIVPNYLTIFATPDAVQQTQIGLKYLEEWVNEDDRVEVDNHIYGDLDGDFFQELAVGRIYGITISDVSSYVGRDLFYDELPHSNDFAVLWAPDFPNMISAGKTIDKLLSATGMNERSVYATNDGGPKMFNPKNDFENKALIAYLDHGSWNGGSLGYTTPDLANNDVHFDSTVVISNACSVNAYDKITEDSPKHMFFGGQLIRRGALAHFAAVEDAGLNADLAKTVVEQIAQGYNNGMALRNVRNLIVPEPIFEFDPFYVLLGDPTFNLNLNRPTNLEEIKIETDTDSKIIKILWPSISAGIKFDFGNKNVKKSEGELFFNHFSTNLLRDYYLKDYRYYENGELKHSEEVFQASTTLVTPLDMAINSINEIEIRSLSFNKLLKCANNPWGSVVCVEDPDNLIAREESVYPLLTRDNKGNDWLYVSILLNGEDIVDKDVLEAREYYLYYD